MNWQQQATKLFGNRYTTPLSHLAGVTSQTIRNWRDKDCAPLWFAQKVNEMYRIWRG